MTDIQENTELRVRAYGTAGPPVVVLHGGPGASGGMAPVARALADPFRVLAPRQRGSGQEPLTVARHVADLHHLIQSRLGDERPALVGHSWGAMLALAYAAAHPGRAAALVLIGCGTFDTASRAQLRQAREARTDEDLRQRIDRLSDEIPDPDQRLAALGELLRLAHAYDPIPTTPDVQVDARAHRETWDDMLRLQEAGVYPTAFAAIQAPTLMLHGADDPHPGPMIKASLEPYIPQLEYHALDRCGHYPWLERSAHEDFFNILREWLMQRID